MSINDGDGDEMYAYVRKNASTGRWYYLDRDYDAIGSFKTKQEASDALDEYIKRIQQEV